MPTFTTPAPIAATVEVAGAQVRVTASDRSDTTVLVKPIDAGSRKDLKVAENTMVELADGRLSVKTKTSGAKEGSVVITIDVPTGSRLAAYLAHSQVHAEGQLGECELHLASGEVKLASIDALRANIASGDVTIDRIGGRTDIDGAAFRIRIGRVDGTVALMNSGGQTWIGHALADLGLRSGNGEFTVDRADASVTATSGSGAIHIGRMGNGQARLETGSGDIRVGIAAGAAAAIDAHSERGAVRNFISAPAEPKPGDDKVSVHARTRHGDITVERAG